MVQWLAMRRRVFNIATALSLLVCAAALAFWILSPREWSRQSPDGRWQSYKDGTVIGRVKDWPYPALHGPKWMREDRDKAAGTLIDLEGAALLSALLPVVWLAPAWCLRCGEHCGDPLSTSTGGLGSIPCDSHPPGHGRGAFWRQCFSSSCSHQALYHSRPRYSHR